MRAPWRSVTLRVLVVAVFMAALAAVMPVSTADAAPDPHSHANMAHHPAGDQMLGHGPDETPSSGSAALVCCEIPFGHCSSAQAAPPACATVCRPHLGERVMGDAATVPVGHAPEVEPPPPRAETV